MCDSSWNIFLVFAITSVYLSIHLTCLVPIALEHGLDALPVAAAESVLHIAAIVAAEALVSPVHAFVPPNGRAIQHTCMKSIVNCSKMYGKLLLS